MLIPGTFQSFTQDIRATVYWKYAFSGAVRSAIAARAPSWVVDDYQFMLDAINGALAQNRALTGSLPMCSYAAESTPYLDSKGNLALYTKPIVALTDNFTLSAGEIFVMLLQDNKRATIVGTTTDGGGGNVVSYNAASYSEGLTRVTLGLIPRISPVAVPGFPAVPYYDGVGIYPDVWLDYMTASNLKTGGSDFLNSFVATLATMIQ
jgi:Peptidase family S41